ncbi:Transglycosylase SLT domain protein [Candidatus Gugararchaeum adminiculabundum]|nr:Transglycosylase SLT domain protein [Candidatus Gugararchaeum adminiculabundum]
MAVEVRLQSPKQTQNPLMEFYAEQKVTLETARKIEAAIQKYSREFDLDPNLVRSIIFVESTFKPHAQVKSYNPKTGKTKHFYGLFQLDDRIVKQYGVKNWNSIDENIKAGCHMLKDIYDFMKDKDLKLRPFPNSPLDANMVAAVYGRNVGQFGAVKKIHSGLNTLSKITEARPHVKKVLHQFELFQKMHEV